MKTWPVYLTAGLLALVLAFAAGYAVRVSTASASSPVEESVATETVYIVNRDPADWSDAAIWSDIPAWEKAANNDFAPIWHTPHVKIEVVNSAPKHGIVAELVKSGSVQGALAYHTVVNGYPRIVDYLGTAKFYGYSQSVDFTHELFEMLADPTTAVTNQGFPYPVYTLGSNTYPLIPGTIWFQEVCDPVEDQSFRVADAQISDFITPNWFNDHLSQGPSLGAYDWMGVVTAPFTVMKGGYAQYWTGMGWQVIQDFDHIRGANGFLKGEHSEHSLG